MDRSSRALDAAVADAPGVEPMFRSNKLTRECGYCFIFRYNKDAFDGLDVAVFRQALSAELNYGFTSTYEPLPRSRFYYPHTKRRHHLSKRYVSAITPSRWKLPVIESLARDRAVLTGWAVFACPPNRAHYLTDAIAKIHENRMELIDAARTTEAKR